MSLDRQVKNAKKKYNIIHINTPSFVNFLLKLQQIHTLNIYISSNFY